MENKIETLMELTGQESGIVVRGDSVIVTNWMYSCPNGGLPLLAAGIGLIAWPGDIDVVKEYSVEDIRDVLPGTITEGDEPGIIVTDMDIVSDAHSDIPALWGYEVKPGAHSDIPALWGYEVKPGAGATINVDDDGRLAPTPGKVYELQDSTIVIAPDGWC